MFAFILQACLNSVLLYQTAMTAVRRRRKRLQMGEEAHLDDVGDEDEVHWPGWLKVRSMTT